LETTSKSFEEPAVAEYNGWFLEKGGRTSIPASSESKKILM
jgi:hypothetical protein